MWKTSTKQNFCFQIYYNIIFYYNSQNTQIQVLENRKQKIVTKHTHIFRWPLTAVLLLLFSTIINNYCRLFKDLFFYFLKVERKGVEHQEEDNQNFGEYHHGLQNTISNKRDKITCEAKIWNEAMKVWIQSIKTTFEME